MLKELKETPPRRHPIRPERASGGLRQGLARRRPRRLLDRGPPRGGRYGREERRGGEGGEERVEQGGLRREGGGAFAWAVHIGGAYDSSAIDRGLFSSYTLFLHLCSATYPSRTPRPV